jgi:hypothetical protein
VEYVVWARLRVGVERKKKREEGIRCGVVLAPRQRKSIDKISPAFVDGGGGGDVSIKQDLVRDRLGLGLGLG